MLITVENLVFQMPDFIHDFGWREHHNVPAANTEMEHTVRNWVQIELHEHIEHYLLYPARSWLTGQDGRAIYKLDIALSFLWGFICGFPPKDIVSYTIWKIRGCGAVKVWKKTINGYEIM